jgi:hypothetical protein
MSHKTYLALLGTPISQITQKNYKNGTISNITRQQQVRSLRKTFFMMNIPNGRGKNLLPLHFGEDFHYRWEDQSESKDYKNLGEIARIYVKQEPDRYDDREDEKATCYDGSHKANPSFGVVSFELAIVFIYSNFRLCWRGKQFLK